jgi:FdhD protein
MADRVTQRRPVVRVTDGTARRTRDTLAAEEPLEIRVNGTAVSVTMRTPGDDFDLALGFCLTEGLVADPGDVETIRYCAPSAGPYTGDFNVTDIATRGGLPVDETLRRNVYTASSCGICGTASIDAVRKDTSDVHADGVRLAPRILTALPQRLRAAQRIFERTGGLHAAGLFDEAGDLLCVREDVGRHNAVDKVVGWAARTGQLPLHGRILMVSGRVAFEIVQKALRAAIPAVAAVSAPSTLAVALAEESGMTLVGFLRGGSMNVYAGAHRVVTSAADR